MPGTDITLTGFEYSVYTRSLRIALAEKRVDYCYEERNPFDPDDLRLLKEKHPFGRVPVLQHRDFSLWESAAMLDYVNASFEGPALVPKNAQVAARMRQVIAVMNNYAYGPLVRQVFSHGVFRPLMGEQSDPAVVQEGLAAAPLVLATLDGFAAEGMVLAEGQVSLAACHVLPMLEYFAMEPRGARMLADYTYLSAWLRWMGQMASMIETRPDLSALAIAGQKQ